MAYQIVAPGLGEVLNDPGTYPADSPSGMTAGAVVAAAYREHGARMHRSALAWTRDPEAAADIAQEAFVRLLREVHRGRSPDNVGAWLQRTVRNLVFSGARRAAVARRHAPRLLRLDNPDEPETVSLRDERCREIKAALTAMASVDQVMLLMAASGASGEEIAGRLGLTRGAARTRLSRARARLRRAIAVQSPCNPRALLGDRRSGHLSPERPRSW
jgi:RNA polymerase sigma factor (sigma-70 family)